MLFELTIVPVDGDGHTSEVLAEAVKLIDGAGLSYQLGPSSTSIEGSWEGVMPAIRACHELARKRHDHVVTLIKVEDERGARDKLHANVESVASKADGALSTDDAA
jgi:uncharacterized protein (TIGR00106 family)